MTTIKSLQAMYLKLGGSLTDTYADIAGGKPVGTYATIPEMIQACTKKAGSGGGGGKDEIFWINATMGNNDGVSLDKTYAEIIAAIEAGLYPIVNAMGVVDMPLAMIDEGAIVFANTIYSEGARFNYLVVDSENAVAVDDISLASTTSVSTAVAPFVVTFTITNPETLEIGSADKTFAEVAVADAAGKRIVGIFKTTVDEREIVVFESDVAKRQILEHGNAYIWQAIDTDSLVSIIYDAEGVHSSVSGWKDIFTDEYVKYATYNITDVATSDVICDTTPSQIWDWFDNGYSVRAKVRGINASRDVYFDLGIINASASDTYEIDFSGTYLDGTSLAWLNIHHESTGGNEAFNLTKKTITTT